MKISQSVSHVRWMIPAISGTVSLLLLLYWNLSTHWGIPLSVKSPTVVNSVVSFREMANRITQPNRIQVEQDAPAIEPTQLVVGEFPRPEPGEAVLPEVDRSVLPPLPSHIAHADRPDVARSDSKPVVNPLPVVSVNEGQEPDWTLFDQITADCKTSPHTEITAMDTEPSSESTLDAAFPPQPETVPRQQPTPASSAERVLPFPGPGHIPTRFAAPLLKSSIGDVPPEQSSEPTKSVLATASAASGDEDDGWKPFDTTRKLVGQLSPSRQPAFVTRETPFAPIGREASPTLSTERSVGNVSLQVTRQTPRKVCADQVFHDAVSVQNDGDAVLDRVVVEQTIPPDCRVVDTIPRAFFDHEVVRWRLSGLKPGASHVCRIALIARQSGIFRNSVRIRALAAASMQIQIDGPHLRLKVILPEVPHVGKVCPILFQIDNVGQIDVDNVALHTDLPAELSYRYGRTLKYEVGTLKVGESHTAHLTAQANRSGDAAMLSRLLVDDAVVQETTDTLQIRQ